MFSPDTSIDHDAPGGKVAHLRSLVSQSHPYATFTPQVDTPQFDFLDLLPGLSDSHGPDSGNPRPPPRENATSEAWEEDSKQIKANDVRERRNQQLDKARQHLEIWESFSGIHQAEWNNIGRDIGPLEEPFTPEHDAPAPSTTPIPSVSTIEEPPKESNPARECADDTTHENQARAKSSQYSVFPKQRASMPNPALIANTQTCATRPSSDLRLSVPPLPRLDGKRKSCPNIQSKPLVPEVPVVSTPQPIAAKTVETWEEPRAPPVPQRRKPLPLGSSRSFLDLRRLSRQQQQQQKRASTPAPPVVCAPRTEDFLSVPLQVDHIVSVFESDSESENGDQNIFHHPLRTLRTKMARRKSHYGEDTRKDRSSYGSENAVPVIKLGVETDAAVDKSMYKRKRSSLDLEEFWYKSKKRITSIIVLYKR